MSQRARLVRAWYAPGTHPVRVERSNVEQATPTHLPGGTAPPQAPHARGSRTFASRVARYGVEDQTRPDRVWWKGGAINVSADPMPSCVPNTCLLSAPLSVGRQSRGRCLLLLASIFIIGPSFQ